MLKWINSVLGGNSVELTDDVSVTWAKNLESILDPLNKLPKGVGRSGLARDILNFVLHGDNQSILNEVVVLNAVSEQLRLTGYHYQDDKEKKPDLYQNFDDLPTAVALRWARFLEACVPTQSRHYDLQFPYGANWPETLMLHSTGTSVTGWSSSRPVAKNLSIKALEGLLIEANIEPTALISSAFSSPVSAGYRASQRHLMVSDLVGYRVALDSHVEVIRPLLQPTSIPQRLHVLTMLKKAESHTLDKLAPELCELVVCSSKQVRALAEKIVRRCGTANEFPLRQIASAGKPEQRLHALRLLYSLALTTNNEALQAFAHEAALADKAPTVNALIGEWSAFQRASANGFEQRFEYELPIIDWSGTLTPNLSSLLRPMWQEINIFIEKENKQAFDHHQRMLANGHKFPLNEAKLYSEKELKSLQECLASDDPTVFTTIDRLGYQFNAVMPSLQKLATNDNVTPVALFKILRFFGLLANKNEPLMHSATMCFNLMHRATGRPTLIELSVMMKDSGYASAALLQNYCQTWGDPIAVDWSVDAVWPYFAHHAENVIATLTSGQTNNYAFDRAGLFRAIGTFPSTPASVVNALFGVALGVAKSDRRAAQDALANYADKTTRIIDGLKDGKSDTRAIAAQWLARLREVSAIPALEQAVVKEKHDVAKGAMLDALQVFGQPVEKYLDRGALLVEATKLLSKGVPKDLEWFPWNALPEVRWFDTKEHVPVEVIRWMTVQAVKQKSAEPNAVLRKYCAMFEPRDREQLGQMVLDTWLNEDTRPIPAEDAMKRARMHAHWLHSAILQSPQYYQNDPNLGRTEEEIVANCLGTFLRQPVGSANASKGLLAVVAACAGQGAVAPTARYLKEWYGSRAAQGKALIAMLAWIDHPSATQLMLAIGSRFRTKSFQEEASKQAEALADRKGWTVSELADRTIPSAGFDETGTVELSYGMRCFTARLLPDFKVELYNPEAKKIASLPEPRQDDDAELAKDSKKAFSAAKKEIRNIVDLQTKRLYEALCTERDWLFEDWQLYLNKHPVVRRLVQRLVWAHVQDGEIIATFRPLDDGTLTDYEENEIDLPSEARVCIAHDSVLSKELINAWEQHLVDYEITPLFQQMGKGTYSLPLEKAKADSIKDFEGYLIEAFALRGRCSKLGYMRGAAEDGGWFHVYEKRFPTLGIQAVIEFTGNPLPEENRTVALLNLSFASTGGTSSWQAANLPLSKLPKVLLSECYNDLRLIAEDGNGFDANWQKKSEY